MSGAGLPALTVLTLPRPLRPTLTRAGVGSSDLAQRSHDVLDLRVVLERVHGQVLAVPGLLVAAVGHLAGERDVVVDPHAAEPQPVGDPQGAADVPGPDARGQAVRSPVGPGHGLVLVGERLDGDDRPEDLALDHVVVLV